MTQDDTGAWRAEPVSTASCPLTDETVWIDSEWASGTVVTASCGHQHRATFEYGSWALENA